MCMEDVRLGRDTMSGMSPFLASVVSTLAIGQGNMRFSLTFPRPLAGSVTYSLNNPAVSGVGLVLGVGDAAFSMNIKTDGDLVRRAWYAVLDAGAQNMALMFTDLPQE